MDNFVRTADRINIFLKGDTITGALKYIQLLKLMLILFQVIAQTYYQRDKSISLKRNMIYVLFDRIDLFRKIPTNQNETLLLETVKYLHFREENTHTKAQEALDFKLTEPKKI